MLVEEEHLEHFVLPQIPHIARQFIWGWGIFEQGAVKGYLNTDRLYPHRVRIRILPLTFTQCKIVNYNPQKYNIN